MINHWYHAGNRPGERPANDITVILARVPPGPPRLTSGWPGSAG